MRYRSITLPKVIDSPQRRLSEYGLARRRDKDKCSLCRNWKLLVHQLQFIEVGVTLREQRIECAIKAGREQSAG